MPLFPSTFEFILFVSLILIWILSEAISGGIIPWLRRSGGKINRKDRGSNLLLRVSSYVSIFIAFVLAISNIAMLPDWFFYPGIFLMVIGILVRQWAMFTLGRFFTLTVGVQKSQKVVDYGPYRFIRHPSYSGMLMTAIGIGVALHTWGGILVILALLGLAIGYRILVEEKFLASELGDGYVQYMKRTKRLIPFVL
jgi:protein-S-isoprenylcysteine O-methyltransferase Ste14